jgi:hypothetical protein
MTAAPRTSFQTDESPIVTVERTRGPFWTRCTSCGSRAEAALFVEGTPVKCARCATSWGLLRLPQPTADEVAFHDDDPLEGWPPLSVRIVRA